MNYVFFIRNIWLLSLPILSILVGCSDVGFQVSQRSCDGDTNCAVVEIEDKRFKSFSGNYTLNTPKADILFVIDNSSSMETEQMRMGESFNGFLNTLTGIDYQIGITTMDISAKTRKSIGDREFLAMGEYTYLQKGYDEAYQDGNLLTFGTSALKVLNNSTPNRVNLFKQTVQIQKQGTYDERGIFAAALAISKNNGSLIRPDASHLAVIMLSDEDVRSRGMRNENNPAYSGLYDIRPQDKKEFFFEKWAQVTAGQAKNLSVHSIIIRDGETDCLDYQLYQNWETAEYGSMYQDLSNDPRAKGIVGSVCASSYTKQVQDMAKDIAKRTKSVPLSQACDYVTNEPEKLPFIVSVNGTSFKLGQPLPAALGFTKVVPVNGVLEFTPELAPSAEVTYSGYCEL